MIDISEKPLNIMCTSAKKSVDKYRVPYVSVVGCNLVRKKRVAATNATNPTCTSSNPNNFSASHESELLNTWSRTQHPTGPPRAL
jgi:hypothetical protein